MTRSRTVALVALCAVVFLAGVGSQALAARKHRLQLPPRPAFPRALSVDETEYQLTPSRAVVSSGRVRINVYNRGMDDHNLEVFDGAGTSVALTPTPLLPGAADEISVTLPAGDYRVVCSLFAGTAISHESYGMWFTLTVQDPPTRPAGGLRAQRR